jgi:hypothetical protein
MVDTVHLVYLFRHLIAHDFFTSFSFRLAQKVDMVDRQNAPHHRLTKKVDMVDAAPTWGKGRHGSHHALLPMGL